MRKNIIVLAVSLLVLNMFNTNYNSFNSLEKHSLFYNYIDFQDTLSITIDVDNEPSVLGLVTNFFMNLGLDSNQDINQENDDIDVSSMLDSQDNIIITNPIVNEESVIKEVVKKKPVKKEIVKKKSVKKEVVKKDPAKKEIVKKEPAEKEIVKKEPAEKEIVKKEPAEKEIVKKEPNKKNTIDNTSQKRTVRKKIKKTTEVAVDKELLPTDKEIIQESSNFSESAKKLILKMLDEEVISMSDVEMLLMKYPNKTIKKRQVNELVNTSKTKSKKRKRR